MEDRHGPADQTIIDQILGGDLEAYGLLVERYGAQLYGLAHHLSGDYDTAADLAQETLIAAYDGLDCLMDRRNFGAWAAGILRNKFRTQKRSKTVRPLSLDRMMEKGFEPVDPKAESNVRGEGSNEGIAHGEVRRCVEALPDKYREMLTLRYSGDLSYRQIARFLGLRVTTVTMRLTYARRLLLRKAKEAGLL